MEKMTQGTLSTKNDKLEASGMTPEQIRVLNENGVYFGERIPVQDMLERQING